MMPNIVRGDRTGGLMVYLAGPGRSNEHAEPHLVAGDPAMLAWHDDAELSRDGALAIARHLDRPRTAFDVGVKGGHVWHCSLSLRAEEGQLTDERWQRIAGEFVGKMGFDDADGTKAPTRWVAVRHGLSKAGNDHVHLVVNLVREDGTKASIHNDQPRAQKACRELEREHGLEVLESAERGRASVGYDPAEQQAAARRAARAAHEHARRQGTEGRAWQAVPATERARLIESKLTADQPRWDLARTVRACSTASADEAEFVRRMRRHGVLVRPRFADGRTDVVTGYSVAARPLPGERPIWYGGGHLARDLTLPRLRQEWPDTPTGAAAAVDEWAAARRQRRPAAPGRESSEPDPQLWRQVGQDLEALREQLRAVPIEDRDTWARVARQTSGAFAAWSTRVEPEPGPLAATADSLARSAELRRSPQQPIRAGLPSAAGAALLLISAGQGGRGTVAQAIMLRQLANLAKALHDMHRADQDARRAAQLAAAVRGDLAKVAAKLPEPGPAGLEHTPAAAATRTARQGQVPMQAPESPLPAALTPRPRTTAGPPARPDERQTGHNERGR